MLVGLLEFKAQSGGKFTDKEAATDLAVNSKKLSGFKQRDLAKRWNWSQSMVSRLWDLLALARQGIESTLNQNESNLCEIEPESHTLNQDESKLHISDNSESEAKERFFPHTPFSKENTPLLKKENTPKGVQKKESFPPENPESSNLAQIPLPTEKNTDGGGAAAPCSELQAIAYFDQRLKSDPDAIAKGFQAALLARAFWWHWDAQDWVDKSGTVVTAATWKKRAATWYRFKEKYGGGTPTHLVQGKPGEGKLPQFFTPTKLGVFK